MHCISSQNFNGIVFKSLKQIVIAVWEGSVWMGQQMRLQDIFREQQKYSQDDNISHFPVEP